MEFRQGSDREANDDHELAMRCRNLLLVIRRVLVRSRSPRLRDSIAVVVSSPPIGCPTIDKDNDKARLATTTSGRSVVGKRERESGGGEEGRKRERENQGGDCHGWGPGEGEKVGFLFLVFLK